MTVDEALDQMRKKAIGAMKVRCMGLGFTGGLVANATVGLGFTGGLVANGIVGLGFTGGLVANAIELHAH